MNTENRTFTQRVRNWPLPSCVLTNSDLFTLYRRLHEKVLEAADLEVRDFVRPNDDDGTFDQNIDWLKSLFVITVTIVGQNGESQTGSDETIFSSPHLPDRITSVFFSSSTRYNVQRNNINPNNYFTLLIDFTKPPSFDLSNTVSNPTPNNSNIHVTGNNDGWVNSLFQTVNEFVLDRKNNYFRNIFHMANMYDILLWFVGFPVVFAIVARTSPYIEKLNLPMFANGALYLYVFLFCLVSFRLLFSYSKWVWPKIQFVHQRDSSALHRGLWLAVMAGLISTLISGLLI